MMWVQSTPSDNRECSSSSILMKRNGKRYRASLFSRCRGLDLGFTGDYIFRGQNYPRLYTNIVFENDFDIDAQTCNNSNPLLTNGWC